MPLRLNQYGEHELTSPEGEFLSTWNPMPLTLERVSVFVDEAYRQGQRDAGAKLFKIEAIIKGK